MKYVYAAIESAQGLKLATSSCTRTAEMHKNNEISDVTLTSSNPLFGHEIHKAEVCASFSLLTINAFSSSYN